MPRTSFLKTIRLSNPRDVIATFGLAYSHCLEELQNHAADFISKNYPIVQP